MMAHRESSRMGVRRQRSSDQNSEPGHSNDDHHHGRVVNHSPPIDNVEHDANDDDDDEYLVSCRCESAKSISTLLSCLRNVAVGNGSQSRGGGGDNHQTLSLISTTQNNATSYSVRSSRHRRSHTNASSSSSLLQPVTVYCSATNMTFHICSTSKQIQASVDMSCHLFSDYSVATTTTTTDQNGPSRVGGEFCINLVTLLECLHCLGTQNLDTTKLCFSYNTTQEVFQLELLEELSGILSTASIPGMLSPDYDDDDEEEGCVGNGENGKNMKQTHGPRLYSLANAFRQSEKYLRIIIQSESLHELITELDYIVGATMAHVTFDNGEFRIGVVGYLGECQVVLPTRGSHIISMEAPDANSNAVARQPTWTYPLHAFMESMRGLEIADETCITINLAGMMAIQHQVIQQDQTTHDTPSFVDFILCSMVDEEEEPEDPTLENDGPVPVLHGNAVITSRPTASRRARIVSQMKQSHENHNRATSDSDDDDGDGDDDGDEENTASSKSHITPTSVAGARLFGSLAMDDDDDDDEDESVQVQVPVSSKVPEMKEGRHVRRRRPRTVASPVRPDPKTSRSLKHQPPVIATTGAKPRSRKIVKPTTKASRWKPDDDNEEEEESGDSDDDREVALALSGWASSSTARPKQRRRHFHHHHRRMIHDNEEDDDANDGSSSPELVYGQQH